MSDLQEQGQGDSFPWVNVQLEWRDLGELIAGISSLKWQGTLAGMDMTESNRSFNRALVNCDSLLMIQRYRHVGQLVDGIMISAGFDCHDPRDHVYGLLGLESPGPGRLIAPDYGASEIEVFVRLATAFLLHGSTNALKILAMAPDLAVIPSSCRQRPAGLPSWVPDLCSLQTDCLVDTTLRTPLFRAGGMLLPSVRLRSSESEVPVLNVRGRIVDIVETTALAFVDYYLRDFPDAGLLERDLWDPSRLRRLQRTTAWLDGCLRVARQAVGQTDQTSTGLSKDSELSFARTMLCGMETGRSPLSDKALAEFPAYLEWLADRATRASRSQDERTLAAILNERPDMHFQEHHVLESSIGGLAAQRRFGVTSRTRFCQLPVRAKAGDRICVLAGSAVPFIIREVIADADRMFELIGACYLDGSMAGEELQGQDAEASLEWIDLR